MLSGAAFRSRVASCAAFSSASTSSFFAERGCAVRALYSTSSASGAAAATTTTTAATGKSSASPGRIRTGKSGGKKYNKTGNSRDNNIHANRRQNRSWRAFQRRSDAPTAKESGVVQFFNVERAFGFIRPESSGSQTRRWTDGNENNVYFNGMSCDKMTSLPIDKGQRVEFEKHTLPDGRVVASALRKLAPGEMPAMNPWEEFAVAAE